MCDAMVFARASAVLQLAPSRASAAQRELCFCRRFYVNYRREHVQHAAIMSVIVILLRPVAADAKVLHLCATVGAFLRCATTAQRREATTGGFCHYSFRPMGGLCRGCGHSSMARPMLRGVIGLFYYDKPAFFVYGKP